MRKYTESETQEKIKEVLDLCKRDGYQELYNHQLINWTGCTEDSKRYYTEVIAKELIHAGVADKLTSITPIDRKNYHAGHSRRRLTGDRTNREEEWFAKDLYDYCSPGIPLEPLGWIFDYQVPLKARRSDKAGKIDLVSYQKADDTVYLLELKYRDNPETLLRCALEISTYYQLLHWENFFESFKPHGIPRATPIKKSILLIRGSTPYQEARDLELDQRPHLKRLIGDLKVSIFGVTEAEPYTVDTMKV